MVDTNVPDTDVVVPEEEWEPSKSQRKREMRQVQNLCAELADLKLDTLYELELPDTLHSSIQQANRLKSSNARNRQLRHAAKILVSEEDLLERIDLYFEERNNQGRNEQQRHKNIEHWRDRLLDFNENVLSDFFNEFPATDRQELSTLVRNARKEKEQNKSPAQQRKLFKYLRDQVM